MTLPRFLLRLAFHLLYHQLAWTYDAVAWLVSFGQWPAWRRCALPFLQAGPVLELAFGTGGLFVDLIERRRRPVGIDLSPQMARIARRRVRRRAGEAGAAARLVRARAQALPFRSGAFANAVATFPTEYIVDAAALLEARRVLQPASGAGPGRLIIVAEGRLRGSGPLRALLEWLYRITGQRSSLWAPASLLARLRQHGFEGRWETVTVEGATARVVVAERSND